MSLAPPEKVRKLQATLHAKAKGSPGYRFYLLYDKVYRRDILEFAYARCRSNAGVLVDSWHYFRGFPDVTALAACADRAFMIQLDDADEEPIGELFEDTLLRRRYPGEGSFDLVSFVALLDESGAPAPKSVEILSTEHQALPLAEAARRAHDSTRAVVDAARRASG